MAGGRAAPSKPNPPPASEPTDTSKPCKIRILESDSRTDITATGEAVRAQAEILDDSARQNNGSTGEQCMSPVQSSSVKVKEDIDCHDVDYWELKPPRVLMENPNAVPLELRSQIHLYATTEWVDG